MSAGAAAVTLEARDGRIETIRVDHARGSAERPLSDRDLEAKFRDNAAIGGSASRADERIAGIWAIEEAPSLRPFMRLMGAGLTARRAYVDVSTGNDRRLSRLEMMAIALLIPAGVAMECRRDGGRGARARIEQLIPAHSSPVPLSEAGAKTLPLALPHRGSAAT